MDHVNVVICTPGHSMMSSYVESLLATAQELNKRKITWAFSNKYSSHVADAREVTLSGTMQNNIHDSRPFEGNFTYDKLMWIDSDIAWSPDDFIKLYESDKNIISGAYLLASGDVVAYPTLMKSSYTIAEVLKMDEPVKIEGAGFGFICIKQGVFETMSRPWFQSVPITIVDEKTGKESTFPIMGEDISFCKRALDAGFDIWFDPKVQVQHHKMMKLTWEGIKP